MKMMKTEMEFVTFDAQDVIATSGELVSYFSGEIKNATETYTFNSCSSAFALSKSDQGFGAAIDVRPSASTINKDNGTKYYVLNSATDLLGNKTAFSIDVTGTNDTPSGEYLDSLDKILGWLTANAKAQ